MTRTIALLGLMILLAAHSMPKPAHAQDPAILTVTGAIEHTNRPPFDAFRYALVVSLDEPFEKAFAFIRADLLASHHDEFTVSYLHAPSPGSVHGPLLVVPLSPT